MKKSKNLSKKECLKLFYNREVFNFISDYSGPRYPLILNKENVKELGLDTISKRYFLMRDHGKRGNLKIIDEHKWMLAKIKYGI